MQHPIRGLAEASSSEWSRLSTSLIGRERAVAVACSLLSRSEVRLLTLTGTGGVGKTRLALAVGSRLQEAFADGVWFVPLSATRDPERVIPLIAQALGLQTGSRPIFESLREFLDTAHLLLVLDNFEQIMEAAPSLTALLVFCPDVKMLVTSRERLRLDGEHEFPVLPLPLPDVERADMLEELAANPSATLFLQRVQAIQPDFQLTPANGQTIARICVHLEGLPLALELAAARIKLLSPSDLLARLALRLRVLTTGSRNAPLRQQTLRQTIQWSYDLLSQDEQSLFRRLGIFSGGCMLEAVEALYIELGEDATSILDGLTSLLDKSLIQRSELEDGTSRLQMLETIREFCLECLQMSPEWSQVRLAHTRYYLRWAEESRKVLFTNRQELLIERYVQEQWNWRAAMRLLMEREDTEEAMRLAGGLSVFWLVWGYSYDQAYLIEGKDFLQQVLRVPSTSVTSTRAWALSVYGGILALLRDLERSEITCRQGLALAREVGDIQYIITSLWMLLLPLITRDDFKAARVVVEEAIALAQTREATFADWGVTWLAGYSLHRAGYIALWQGRYTEAREALLETMTLCADAGEQFFLLWSMLLIGEADFLEGKEEEAQDRLEMVMALYKGLHLRTQIAEALGFLGLLALHRGSIDKAYELLSENLQMRKDVGDEQGIAWAEIWLARAECARQNLGVARHLLCDGLRRAIQAHSRMYTTMGLEELGKVMVLQGEAAWAARLFGAAEVLREAMDAPLPNVERQEYEERVATARATLGPTGFHAAWARGRNMTPHQAYTEQESARVSAPASTSHVESAARMLGLTPRELDVLRLLAQGLTNAQIAETLIIGRVTVNGYVRSIYRKLAVTTRAAATRYALDHHLV
ncbi:MAG TPA: LuxR C-terminal-related transcriptional regulator [Ktedonobacteraceae bacterium]